MDVLVLELYIVFGVWIVGIRNKVWFNIVDGPGRKLDI